MDHEKLSICLTQPGAFSTEVLIVLKRDEWQAHLDEAVFQGWMPSRILKLTLHAGVVEESEVPLDLGSREAAFVHEAIRLREESRREQETFARVQRMLGKPLDSSLPDPFVRRAAKLDEPEVRRALARAKYFTYGWHRICSKPFRRRRAAATPPRTSNSSASPAI